MAKTIDKLIMKIGDKLIFYYVATVIIFLIFGAPDLKDILDKIFMTIGITIGIFLFPLFLKQYFNMQEKNIKNIKGNYNKILKFQLLFFQTFAIMIIMMAVLIVFNGISFIPMSLLIVNIGLNLLLEVAKIREKYFNS